jgi:hypothetical protein
MCKLLNSYRTYNCRVLNKHTQSPARIINWSDWLWTEDVAFKYRKLLLAYLSWCHVRMASCAQPRAVFRDSNFVNFSCNLAVYIKHCLRFDL